MNFGMPKSLPTLKSTGEHVVLIPWSGEKGHAPWNEQKYHRVLLNKSLQLINKEKIHVR